MTRIGPTLEELGITSKPEATLSREDAFFVLVDDLLLYRDARILRRVSLRDLTRIHSDDSGTLRVETPAGTALSASLLGFEPDEVQPFFLRVRDATAYAKAQAKRAQERESGEAPPSPFARVPRAQPAVAPTPPRAAPSMPAPVTSAAPADAPTEEFEPYAPYERPRTFADRLGSVVRVIKRRPETPDLDTPKSESPESEAPEQAQTAQAVAEPGGLEAGVGSSVQAVRDQPTQDQPSQDQLGQEDMPRPTSQPSPASSVSRRVQSAPVSTAPAQVQRPASVSMEEALRSSETQTTVLRPAAAEPAASSVTEMTPAMPEGEAHSAAPAVRGGRKAPGGPLAWLNPAGTPDLRVWPPRLRLVAGLLLLTAVALTLYYLLNGSVAAGLWLLVVGVAGAVFLLAAADAVQVLATRLPETAASGALAPADSEEGKP
ncbi:hypothetical protein GCM10017783_00800 [Deinococcus piscis]|uniref:Uncharacterized protein n=1 Tax=Deinococcus piscis TaxID=394230 RepID=A0ABQ3JYW4_9DEIO|nr:hypothetical protein [Deinococcus piscis]GHF92805.1 hypothetical protein GCM10017783_00800 [Deinococcus piscis]